MSRWSNALFYQLYLIISFCFSALVGPLFLFHKRGRRSLSERFGSWGGLPDGELLWIHAASFGEAQAMLPLVRQLKRHFPRVPILFTAVSPTGLDAVAQEVDCVRLLPFDHPFWLKRALGKISVKLFLFGETEIWPALLSELSHRRVPMAMVNGTITKRTIRWYMHLRALFTVVLPKVSYFYASDLHSREVLISLGAPCERTMVTGNTKYDRVKRYPNPSEQQRNRDEFFAGTGPVFLLASVHPGEGESWIQHLRILLEKGWRVVVAPRHQERFEYFAELLVEHQLSFQRRSDCATSTEEVSVILLDTLGELEKVYSFATLSFLGGTFIPLGGHNPLEAAAYGCYQVSGPHSFKVEQILSQLVQAGAAERLQVKEDIELFLQRIAGQPAALRADGEMGIDVWSKMAGATERILASLLENVLAVQGDPR